MATVDAFTGWAERPISEAPTNGETILAKSRDGETYMKVQFAHSSWLLTGTNEVARPSPHVWLVNPEGPNNDQ